MSTCSNSKMQTADPARTPAFNSNMIFNPQAVSWSVQMCPVSTQQTLPEHISPKSTDFESWTTHFDTRTSQETEDFSGDLNSTTASWSWSKPHSWSRLDNQTTAESVRRVKHTQTQTLWLKWIWYQLAVNCNMFGHTCLITLYAQIFV